MKNQLKKLTLSALFLAIGMVLPIITGQIQALDKMLLPMHLPVFLCGLICGWQYGLAIGFVLPFVRFLVFSMPPIYPTAVAMAFELATYGFVSGFIYSRFKKPGLGKIYCSMLPAMLIGRVVWGICEIILLGINGNKFTFSMFIAGAFLNAVPGIILLLILVPAIMTLLNKKVSKQS